jgi:hypothetical protein
MIGRNIYFMSRIYDPIRDPLLSAYLFISGLLFTFLRDVNESHQATPFPVFWGLITVVSIPLWTLITDRLQRPKFMIIIMSCVCLVLCFLKYLQPNVPLLPGLFFSFWGTLHPLIYHLTLKMLGEENQSWNNFGSHVMFQSLGMQLAIFLITRSDIPFLYIMVGPSGILFLSVTLSIVPRDKKKQSDTEEERKTVPSCKPTFLSLFSPSFVILLVVCILERTQRAIGATFLTNEFFKDSINGFGISSGFLEYIRFIVILTYILSKPLIDRIGTNKVMIGAQSLLMLRMIIYGFLPKGTETHWHVYVVGFCEALEGMASALFLVASVITAATRAHLQLQATAQGMLATLHYGIYPAFISAFELLDAYIMPNDDESQGLFNKTSGFLFLAAFFSLLAVIILMVSQKKEAMKDKSTLESPYQTRPAAKSMNEALDNILELVLANHHRLW